MNWDKIKELYKIFAFNKFNLFVILPKPMIFSLALFAYIVYMNSKIQFVINGYPSSFNDFDNLTVLLFITINLLIVFLLRIMNWNFPGLAIIWLSLNHFDVIFRSDWRLSITSFIDLAQLYMVLLSTKLHMSVFSTNQKMSFKKILKNNEPRIEPCGIPRRILNHELKVKSSLTLCVR